MHRDGAGCIASDLSRLSTGLTATLPFTAVLCSMLLLVCVSFFQLIVYVGIQMLVGQQHFLPCKQDVLLT